MSAFGRNWTVEKLHHRLVCGHFEWLFNNNSGWNKKFKGGPAYFYTLVSDDSEELKFAANRQRFLAEQGYDYLIEDWAA